MTDLRNIKRLIALLLICLSCFYCFGVQAAYDPVALYLTWQRSPDSTMTIRWITPLDKLNNLVKYQQEGGSNWITLEGSSFNLPGNTPYLLHHVELTNLLPETNYFFKIGHDGLIYKFQTMPATLHGSIRFVAGGDMYHDTLDILSATNRQAAKTSPLFALVGGDIAYAVDSKTSFLPRWTHPLVDVLVGQKFDRWLTWLAAWKNDMVTPDGRLVPILPVIGNHDTSGRFGQTPAQAPFFYSLFAMPGPQGYNVLDFGNYMSLFLLDSGHTHPIDGQQAQWLADHLKERSSVSHKFAIYHVPAYPSVRPVNEEISTQIRKFWVPSFDKYHLTAAFENHDHDYKRTYPLINGQKNAQGVLYLGDGAWGVKNPRKASNLSQKGYLAKVLSARHFIMAILKQDQRQIVAISSEGNVLDEFSW